MMNHMKFETALKAISTAAMDPRPPYAELEIPVTYFRREGVYCVSAEDGGYFADYYGEFRGGYPWVHPKLEELAKQFKGHWEWNDPGSISFYED